MFLESSQIMKRQFRKHMSIQQFQMPNSNPQRMNGSLYEWKQGNFQFASALTYDLKEWVLRKQGPRNGFFSYHRMSPWKTSIRDRHLVPIYSDWITLFPSGTKCFYCSILFLTCNTVRKKFPFMLYLQVGVLWNRSSLSLIYKANNFWYDQLKHSS